MSYSPTANGHFDPESPPRLGWRISKSITGSLVLHTLLVAGFIYQSQQQPLQMAGKEGGVLAFNMVNVAPEPVSLAPASSPALLAPPQPPVVHSVRITHPDPAIVLPEPVKPKANKIEPEPRTHQKSDKRETQTHAKVKTVKPTASPVAVSPAPVKTDETKSSSTLAAKSRSASDALSASKSSSSPNNVSAATVGNSDSGKAAQGSGNATSLNVKALHRRVNYPQKAKSLGVEGRVRIKFDITSSGTVTNVRVLSETPSGVFASAIGKDIARWRYQTQGEVNDQVVSIVFKLNGQVELEN